LPANEKGTEKNVKRTALASLVGLVATILALGGIGPRPPAAEADLSGCDGNKPGVANPAAIYCDDLGYEYRVVDSTEGQHGVCVFPDGSECDEWGFLAGKCGQAYSYCAKQGYGLTTKTDGKNPFTPEYSVCVRDREEIGAVTDLMRLSEKASTGSRPVEQIPGLTEGGASIEAVPASFDWRNKDGKDWMTSVKNQGACGSCWAFSAVGAVEATYNIEKSNPDLDLDLSEEYLVSDCYDGDTGCCGGSPTEALDFIRLQGIPDEACLLYADGGCSCGSTCDCTYSTGGCSDVTCSDRCSDWQARIVTIGSENLVPANRIKDNLVARGPLSAVIGVGAAFGGHFDGDTYRCDDDSDANHGVVIAGYNDAGGYWIVKNSWGATWNGDGYFKVGYGECAIESDVHDVTFGWFVGGIAEPPDVDASPLGTAESSDGSSSLPYAAFAGTVAGLVVLGTGGWYARRRYSVRRR
jgi:putative hemolysin